MIIAHKNQSTNETQSLEAHLFNVALDAYKLAREVKLENTAFIIGILHDLGKSDPLFQNMIINNTKDKVNHSSAGATYLRLFRDSLRERGLDKEELKEYRTYIDCMSYVILAHHGLFDVLYLSTGTYENKMMERIRYNSKDLKYDFEDSVLSFLKELDKEIIKKLNKNIDDIIEEGFKEYKELFNKLSNNKVDKEYYLHCYVRLLLSILKNADVVDTINAYEKIIEKPDDKLRIHKIEEYYTEINNLYDSFGEPTTEINKARNIISSKIEKRSLTDSTGIYRLNLPTGAGKTNLTLLYSINQMKHMNKKRMFYVAPFLSILEQNAQVIKENLKDEKILEHHSNAIDRNLENTDKDYEIKEYLEDKKSEALKEYILESWDETVILTTMVQFFNTLFKDKSANIRRFFNLNNSVVILDEVQSLPIEVTHNFNLMLNFISKIMNTTFILCTATQPLYDYDALDYKMLYGGLNTENIDLVELTNEERDIFKRTVVRLFNKGKVSSLEEMSDFALENSDKSILIILNTKKAVLKTYEYLKNNYNKENLYYLTTNMCAKHRSDIIGEIRTKLENKEKLICISSQLIEAGVDLDFEFLIRSYAGIDSIIQAMGRCNREGKMDGKGEVYLINLSNDEENIKMLESIKDKKYATEKVLDRNLEKIINNNGIVDIETLNDEFYRAYYNDNYHKMNYELEENNIIDALSINTYQYNYVKNKYTKINQAYKSASSQFNLINNETDTVIVYYRESKDMIETLINYVHEYSKTYEDKLIFRIKDLIKKLQPYTIGLYLRDDKELNNLLLADKSLDIFGIKILNESNYDEYVGFNKDFNFDDLYI